MQAIEFDEVNCVFAKDQDEYTELPAYLSKDGEMVSCFKLSPLELAKINESGLLWVSVLTFNNPLQPLLLSTDKPELT
jgi:hypothetical protein